MAHNGSSLSADRLLRGRRKRHAGFTLLEAIVAIVMFTFIILAVSQAFNISLQATSRSQHRQEDDGSVRAVFDVITRDILAAYPSHNSPTSVFVTSGGGSSAGPGDLLAFTALATRLQAPELDTQSSNGRQQPTNQNGSPPQTDLAFVRYNFDAGNGTLYRILSALPSQQNLTPVAPTPDQTVARNIVSIQLSFWDQTKQNWRTDWDYEQQNQIGVIPLNSSTTSSAASTSPSTGASSAGTANTTATGDTYLPSAVKVTVTLQQSNGQNKDYVTTIPLGASQTFVDPNQTANVNTYPPTTAGTSTATSGP